MLLAAAVSQRAVELRNLGIAQLENEQPAEAAATFRSLIEAGPADPLGHANLAIAELRQQRYAEALRAIERALETAPGQADLLAIQGEILQWSGQPEAALELFRRAAAAAPRHPMMQYALLRQATTLGDAEALGRALDALATLRPENLVVLLQQGQRAIQRRDRAGASKAFLRVRELLWGAPPMAAPMLQEVLDGLAAGDVEAARVPALRLENVLKVTSMYQQSLRELSLGIQGAPVLRFRDEPPPASFGAPVPVRFRAVRLSTEPLAGRALAAADLDGDRRPDAAWIEGSPLTLRIRLARAPQASAPLPAAGLTGLLALDLDNDGNLDLLGYGPDRVTLWRGTGGGAFEPATDRFGLAGAGATAAAPLDFDVEGDLDLALAGGKSGAGELFRNALAGPLEAVGRNSLPALALGAVHALAVSDLDRDGDLDLLVAHEGGLAWLDNLRQGEFADRTAAGGLGGAAPGARAVVSADLDNDGWPDLVAAGRGLTFLRNRGGRFEAWAIGETLRTSARFEELAALDADNDGRLDLAVAGEGGVAVLAQRDGPSFAFLPLEGSPLSASALVAADLDGDGDQDLLAGGSEGLHRLDNEGGNANRWLAVRLRGLDKGSGKNNLFGLGSTLEVRAGAAYQFREATGDLTHFGLGRLREAEVLRVVWTNGVPQNRLAVAADQLVVEEQLLKGSCPFLYVWDGERIAFVTDLLWGAPIGLPVAPGVWAGAAPGELVRVDGARPIQRGEATLYDLRITEELWEAAFFDLARLWVVDHPAEVEVESSLRIVPGRRLPEAVRGTRELRPVAAAWDAAGRDVTGRVARRDEVYADGWEPSRYQGVAAEPWTFTFDLGAAPPAPVRLHLAGWIFPADASLNLALAQRRDLAPVSPRLEVETPAGWQVLLPELGLPAGKTKAMVVDTPPLPPGARRLRIVSNLWLSWDRIAWSLAPADSEPIVRARLAPAAAELRYRGFSALVRQAPNAPHSFDYARATAESPWLPFPGRYTRYGDVLDLLVEADDRSVILGPGDEIVLTFDVSELTPPPPGWMRSVFLESHGWDKDADRNTYEAAHLEPLPFRAMSGYPYGSGERFPDTALHRDYLERWLTRVVPPALPPPTSSP